MSATVEKAKHAYERGDFATARLLYEQLVQEGHAHALVFLGRMYIDGDGGVVDLERAEALFDQAIALGVKEGVLQKASLFRARGDRTNCFHSIREAARLGILPAQYQLALCYETADGVARDSRRALAIMRIAAKRGHLGAQIYVARRLLRNPLRPADFAAGLLLIISATVKSIYQIFRNPYSDLLR